MTSQPEQPPASGLVPEVYNTAYKVGFSPWDFGPMPELVDLIEGEQALTPGRAVDLGCGRGGKSVYLAQHGWKVTGVDIAPEALKQARRNAAENGVEIEFVQCDLVELPAGVISATFDFLLDFGCAHSLRDEAKGRYAANIAELAAPGATLYLYAFSRGPLSVRPEQIDTAFGSYWELVSATPGSMRNMRGTRDARPTWYRMTRRT